MEGAMKKMLEEDTNPKSDTRGALPNRHPRKTRIIQKYSLTNHYSNITSKESKVKLKRLRLRPKGLVCAYLYHVLIPR